MEQNIINEGIETMVEDVVVDGVVDKAPSIAKFVGTGTGIVAVVAAIAWVGKKIYDGCKSKKELHKHDKEIIVEAEKVEEVAESEA